MARKPRAEFQITADDRTKAVFDRVQASMRLVRNAAFGVAGASTAIAAATTKAIAHADAIAKNAKASGLASDTYQELIFTMSQFGVSQEKTNSSLERFTKRIGEAANGTGAAAAEYERLGIPVRNANGEIRASEDILRDVATAMQGMDSEATRAASAAALFGREGVRMKDALRGGPEVLDEYARTARELGLVLDANLLKNAEAASDQLDRMKRIAGAQLTVALADLFPLVIGAGNAFAAAVPHIRDFFDMLNPDSELRLYGRLAEVQERIAMLREEIAKVPADRDGLAKFFAEDMWVPPGAKDVHRSIFGGDPEEMRQELEGLLKLQEEIQARIKSGREARQIDTRGLIPDAPGIGGGAGGIEAPGAAADRARRTFEAIHEQRLAAEDKVIELEQFRRERQLMELEAERERLAEHQALTAELEEEFRTAREESIAASEARITELKNREAERQKQIEEDLQRTREMAAARGQDAVMGSLQALAEQSKGVKIAMLAFEKGKAIADVIVLTQVAAARALAELGPVKGAVAATAIKAAGAASIGLIAQQSVASLSGGGGGSAGGGGFGGGFGSGQPQDPGRNAALGVQESDTNAAANTLRIEVDTSAASSDNVLRAIADGLSFKVKESGWRLISPDSEQAAAIRQGR